MRHLRWNGQATIDFFKDEQFVNFRDSLDSEMKKLQSNGTSLKKRQAEVLTEDEEDLLWKKGLLGDKTPQALLNTIIFHNGLYFALRSGKEHRQLRSDPCQIEVIERPGERSYLKYEAGIPGYKTNHSLRATAATRLYQSGVDEQLVMERTGHQSLEGVRSYKRISDIQREALSDILNKRTR